MGAHGAPRALRYALAEARRREPARAFHVFERSLVDGLGVPEACARTGLDANQVYKSKGRVLAGVRATLLRLGMDADA